MTRHERRRQEAGDAIAIAIGLSVALVAFLFASLAALFQNSP